MRKDDLNKMLSLVDDKYLDEASPVKKKANIWASRSLFMKLGSIAACFLLVLNIVLLPLLFGLGNKIEDMENALNEKSAQLDVISDTVNNPHTQNYYELHLGENKDGTPSTILVSSPSTQFPQQYQDIIDLLKDGYSEGFIVGEELEDALDKIESSQDAIFDESMKDESGDWENMSGSGNLEDMSGKLEEDMSDKSETDAEDSYKETTDLQTQGVIEGDIIKRSNKYIFHLNGSTLNIYSIDGKFSERVGTIELSSALEYIKNGVDVKVTDDELVDRIEEDYAVREMYLSCDCKTVSIIVSDILSFGSAYVPYVTILSVSVEDPSDIYIKNVSTLFGSYVESRMIEDELFVFTKHYARRDYLAIPQYSDGEGFKLFDKENIHVGGRDNNTYLLAYRMNDSTLKMNKASAFLSYGDDIYVSENNIYLTNEKTQKTAEEKNTVTEILRVEYKKGGFENKGSVVIDGYLKDRYSLSEYDGFLRAVTTDNGVRYDENGDVLYQYSSNANLYIVELESMQVYNSLIRFAPDGETVRSVRFKRAYAYVCTATQMTDPVFFIDMSDVNNLECKDTGTITGFSTTLIDFGGDLLGIGVDSGARSFKLEVYRETETGVERVCSLIKNATYASEYKAYYINRELGLIGLAITDYYISDHPNRYVLYRYDGSSFIEVLNVETRGTKNLHRGILIDDYFYILSNDVFMVEYVPAEKMGITK
ncbi:MAG: beta-propeller domain-containing protein [Clostridia bacterium]|nr:beta-propeller domain-containing protein [Clostridia bacterium]